MTFMTSCRLISALAPSISLGDSPLLYPLAKHRERLELTAEKLLIKIGSESKRNVFVLVISFFFFTGLFVFPIVHIRHNEMKQVL